MESNELTSQDVNLTDQNSLEVSTTTPETPDLSLSENSSLDSSQSPSPEESPDKKIKKRKLQTLSNETVINVGDRVTVSEEDGILWSDGSLVPRWIRTRRFYVLSISKNECEIGLSMSSKASGKINSKYLNKVR